MILDLPILQILEQELEKNKLIHQPKGVGCQKVLFKTNYTLKLLYVIFLTYCQKIVLRRFPLITTSKP